MPVNIGGNMILSGFIESKKRDKLTWQDRTLSKTKIELSDIRK